MSSPTIVVCARDPGGARSILPILTDLSDYGRIKVIGFGSAEKLFREAGWQPEPLAAYGINNLLPESLDTLLSSICADVMLTSSTDWRQADSIEPRLVAAANRAGVPSIVVLDHICNLEERFGLGYARSEDQFLPDLICLPHRLAEERLLALGVDEARLRVVGYAWLDQLAGNGGMPNVASATVRSAARARISAKEAEVVCMFVGELMTSREDFVSEDEAYGFDEILVLDALVNEIRQAGVPVRLILKPHPKDRELAKYHSHIGEDGGLGIVMADANMTNASLLAACDVVFGMTSMLMVEAVVSGCPTISLQIGLRREDALVTNECGASQAVYDIKTLSSAVQGVIAKVERREALARMTRNFVNDGQATNRLNKTIKSFLDERGML